MRRVDGVGRRHDVELQQGVAVHHEAVVGHQGCRRRQVPHARRVVVVHEEAHPAHHLAKAVVRVALVEQPEGHALRQRVVLLLDLRAVRDEVDLHLDAHRRRRDPHARRLDAAQHLRADGDVGAGARHRDADLDRGNVWKRRPI